MTILHQGPANGEIANQFSADLIGEIGGEIFWDTEQWDISALGRSVARRSAMESASEADVFILAFDTNVELDDDFKAWMENWESHLVGQSPVLMTLFNGAMESQGLPALTFAFLTSIVERSGLTFLYRLGNSIVEYRLVPTTP